MTPDQKPLKLDRAWFASHRSCRLELQAIREWHEKNFEVGKPNPYKFCHPKIQPIDHHLGEEGEYLGPGDLGESIRGLVGEYCPAGLVGL